MAILKIPFGKFLEGAASPIVKKVMTSLGLGVISFAAVATALDTAINFAHNAYSGLPMYLAALAGLGGVGDGLGIIAGALVFRVGMNSFSKIGVLPK